MIKVNPCALYRPRSFPLTRMTVTVTVGWGQHSWKSFFVVSMVLILSNFDPSNFTYQNLETQVISPTRIWQINTFHSRQSEFIGNSYRNMAEVLLIEEAPSITAKSTVAYPILRKILLLEFCAQRAGISTEVSFLSQGLFAVYISFGHNLWRRVTMY